MLVLYKKYFTKKEQDYSQLLETTVPDDPNEVNAQEKEEEAESKNEIEAEASSTKIGAMMEKLLSILKILLKKIASFYEYITNGKEKDITLLNHRIHQISNINKQLENQNKENSKIIIKAKEELRKTITRSRKKILINRIKLTAKRKEKAEAIIKTNESIIQKLEDATLDDEYHETLLTAGKFLKDTLPNLEGVESFIQETLDLNDQVYEINQIMNQPLNVNNGYGLVTDEELLNFENDELEESLGLLNVSQDEIEPSTSSQKEKNTTKSTENKNLVEI